MLSQVAIILNCTYVVENKAAVECVVIAQNAYERNGSSINGWSHYFSLFLVHFSTSSRRPAKNQFQFGAKFYDKKFANRTKLFFSHFLFSFGRFILPLVFSCIQLQAFGFCSKLSTKAKLLLSDARFLSDNFLSKQFQFPSLYFIQTKRPCPNGLNFLLWASQFFMFKNFFCIKLHRRLAQWFFYRINQFKLNFINFIQLFQHFLYFHWIYFSKLNFSSNKSTIRQFSTLSSL